MTWIYRHDADAGDAGNYEGCDSRLIYIPGGDEESASCGAGETPKTHCLHTMEITALLNLTAKERLTKMFRTPWKMNGWNLEITHLERKMIFQTSMIMFHA